MALKLHDQSLMIKYNIIIIFFYLEYTVDCSISNEIARQLLLSDVPATLLKLTISDTPSVKVSFQIAYIVEYRCVFQCSEMFLQSKST